MDFEVVHHSAFGHLDRRHPENWNYDAGEFDPALVSTAISGLSITPVGANHNLVRLEFVLLISIG